MMGLAGFEFTSASGKKFQCTPMARASWPVMRPNVSASSILPSAAEGHGVRKVRGAQQAHGHAALKISCEQQRQLRFLLQTVEQFRNLVRLGAQQERAIDVNRHGERAHVIFLHGLEPLEILGALHVEKAGAAPDHEDLADFFFDGEPVERLLGPLVAARGVEGSGARMLVFGKSGQRQG